MASKHVVVISKQFNPPAPITVDVTHERIKVAMSLDEFLGALVAEIGSPAGLFRQATLEQRLRAAAETVCTNMKQATIPVMSSR